MHPFCPPEEGSYSVYTNFTQYCEIPYRVIVPLKVDNLLVAGRCVSRAVPRDGRRPHHHDLHGDRPGGGHRRRAVPESGVRPRDLDGKLVRQELIGDGVPLDKVPDGYWAFLAESSKNDGINNGSYRLRGDMVGIRLPDGRSRCASAPCPSPTK